MHSIHDITSYDITGKGFDKKVDIKVRVCHMEPLKRVEAKVLAKCGIKVHVSLRSSWRPVWWERLKNRTGRSEHTYGWLGATDVTCDGFADNWEILLDALISETHYTRLTVYHTENGGFIHCDYKNPYNDAYVYNSKWVRQYKIER